jgi:copper chaperone
MLKLTIPSMTCNHCIRTISTAVARIDADAKLAFDLAKHQVEIETSAPEGEIIQAIKSTGYSIDDESAAEEASAHCCGSCHA